MNDEHNKKNQYIEVQHVRVIPAIVEFDSLVSGEVFFRQIIIQNVGKSSAFIRIASPNSKDYTIDSIPRGQYLPPGLRIIRKIKVNYHDNTSKICILPIYINEIQYDYKIVVRVFPDKIEIKPKELNFGMVTAGSITAIRKIEIKNNGLRAVSFYIDLSNCRKLVTAEPLKGQIKPKFTTIIIVKIISFKELTLDSTLVVKCGSLITPLPIKARVTLSKLEAVHPNATEHFTLLNFPPTYFGLTSELTLVIRNFSSEPKMFTVMGELDDKRDDLQHLQNACVDFKFFSIYPDNGFMEPDETKVFRLKFQPRKIDTRRDKSTYYFCTIVIHRFNCTHLILAPDLRDKIFDVPPSTLPSYKESTTTQGSMGGFQASTIESDHMILDKTDAQAYFSIHSVCDADYLRIYLYGAPALPVIDVIPNSLHLDDLTLNNREVRVLEFKNCSKNLPIIIRHKKVAFVRIKKNDIFLKPMESVEISIEVTARQLGVWNIDAVFDLVYFDFPRIAGNVKNIGVLRVPIYFNVRSVPPPLKPELNRGITPNYLKEVGKNCEAMNFNSSFCDAKGITIHNTFCLDKYGNDLVALPNDTQQSLRPYRSTKTCRTLFAHIPRYIQPLDKQYQLTTSNQEFKHKMYSYYTDFIRNYESKSTDYSSNGDYTLTDVQKILYEDLKISKKKCKITEKNIEGKQFFIPLTPAQMNKIQISPSVIRTGKIASNFNYIIIVNVYNGNPFSVRLIVRSDKSNVIFLCGSHDIINQQTSCTVRMMYNTSGVGYFTSNLNFIFNESTMLTLPVLADVVPRSLNLSVQLIEFMNFENLKYLDVINPLNVSVTFMWVILSQNFVVYPSMGVVPAGTYMSCVVRFLRDIDGPLQTDACLHSGDNIVKKVKLVAKVVHKKFTLLGKGLDFGSIPLNEQTMGFIVIQNTENYPVQFTVEDFTLSNYIKPFPKSGIIGQCSVLPIYFTALFPNCVRFNINIKIRNKAGILEVPICGSVIYPDILITPNCLKLEKIPSSRTTHLKFSIKNKSSTFAKLKFDMTENEEFKISDSVNHWDAGITEEMIIQANGSRQLYLHFLPTDTCASYFYLPNIINNMIGPPISTDTISTKVEYYLNELIEDCEYNPTPPSIPTVRVRSFATEPKIIITPTTLVVTVLPTSSEKEYFLRITNNQITPDEVCIRTDQLKHPIYMGYVEGKNITFGKCSISFPFLPEESTCFSITFKPSHSLYGRFRALIPIFLRSDNSPEPHRIISLDFSYVRPSICLTNVTEDLDPVDTWRANTNYMYLGRPLPPVNVTISYNRLLKFSNHFADCVPIASVQKTEAITWNCEIVNNSKQYISETEYTVLLKHWNPLSKIGLYRCSWVVSCSCGGYWKQEITGCTENSFLTTYMHVETYWGHILAKENAELQAIEQFVYTSTKAKTNVTPMIYPFFPRDDVEIYQFMCDCVQAAEQYLYTQVFFGQWNHKIPYGLYFPNFGEASKESIKRQTALTYIPLAHMLINLVGPKMYDYLGVRAEPPTDIEKVKYLMEMYSKAMNFLNENGASFSYIRPEYLLSYKLFTIYKEKLMPPAEFPLPLTVFIDNIESHHRLTTQSWLDFILQTFKVLVLNRLVTPTKNTCKKPKNPTPLDAFFAASPPPKLPHILNDAESMILAWLEFHYNENKDNIWPNKKLPNRFVNIFNDSLLDGIVFAVVTATYCPYLIPFMKGMFARPETHEEYAHNVITLMQCWEMLNYSYNVVVEHIVNKNVMAILMLSAYLYECLPHMYPFDTLNFSAGLTLTTGEALTITNVNSFPIAYKSILISNDFNCFTVDKGLYVILPGKTCKIGVTYFAKFARQANCTLYLSGEVVGYRFSNNKCVNLIGNPDLLYATTTIKYPVVLYDTVDVQFTIKSPYMTEAKYDLQQSYNAVDRPLELENILYHYERGRLGCGRFVPTNENYEFDENGVCVIRGIMAPFLNQDMIIWLYFRNKTVGDFTVKLNTIIKDSVESEQLTLSIPFLPERRNIETFTTRFEHLFLEIPNKNRVFFKATRALLIKLTKGDEAILWKKIVDSTMGINILERLLMFIKPRGYAGVPFHCKSSEYKVQVDDSLGIILPSTIMFEDECSDGAIKVPIKFKNLLGIPNTFTFSLESEVLQRKRVYIVKVVLEKKMGLLRSTKSFIKYSTSNIDKNKLSISGSRFNFGDKQKF